MPKAPQMSPPLRDPLATLLEVRQAIRGKRVDIAALEALRPELNRIAAELKRAERRHMEVAV